MAHQLDHFIIDAVHQAGAQNDLVLARVEKRAFHVVQVFHGLGVDLFLVGDDEPQAGGAVADRDDVAFAAHLVNDGGSQFFVGHDGSSFVKSDAVDGAQGDAAAVRAPDVQAQRFAGGVNPGGEHQASPVDEHFQAGAVAPEFQPVQLG